MRTTKLKKPNLDHRKKNCTVNIIALPLATKMLLLHCPVSDMGAPVCGQVLQPCATAGPVTTHRGLGVWRREHCLSWEHKSEFIPFCG